MRQKSIVLIGFIVLKFVLQYVLIHADYELQRDEFLHLDQANHLAWGYLSVPPVTSWISCGIQFLGNTLFWIRFFPALFGALTIVVVWKTIEILKGNWFALILGACCVLFSSLMRLNLLYQPNSLEVLCWTLFFYILIRYINSENPKWFYIGMVVLALGFLNKYTIVFMVFGLIASFILTNRSIFVSKDFYCSILLFLLLISPNLVWQYNTNFPVFHHLKLLSETQLINVNRWDFIKDQLFFFLGSFFVILSALFALLFYPDFKKYRFFFWTWVLTLLLFIVFKAKSYYAIGLYPIYLAFGSVYLETILNKKRNIYVQTVVISIPIVIFMLLIPIVFPIHNPTYTIAHSATLKKYGLLRWEDGKDHALPQDYADMLGWKELAEKVESIYVKLPENEATLILCDNYGQAGAINYYSKNKNLKAVSFNADYINWFQLDQKYLHLIRIKELKNSTSELEETTPYFKNSYKAGTIKNDMAREYGTTIFVFENAKININKRIKAEILNEKSKYSNPF